MKKYSILLNLPEEWREPIQTAAKEKLFSVSYFIQQAIQVALDLPEDPMSFVYHRPRVQKKAAAKGAETYVQCRITREAKEFLYALSTSKSVSLKTVASTILHRVCKNLPSKPLHQRIESGKVKPPMSEEVATDLGVELPDHYNLKFKVPTDWLEVLDANAELNGITRYEYLSNIFEGVYKAQQKALAIDAAQQASEAATQHAAQQS